MKEIINFNINTKDFNRIFHSKSFGDFKIIEDYGMVGNCHKVKIKFIDTGYEKEIFAMQLRYGNVRDDTIFPYLNGIGDNTIYHSKFCGEYKILRSLPKNNINDTIRMVEIEFLKTGTKKIVQYSAARDGYVGDPVYNIDFNKTYHSTKSGDFKILSRINPDGTGGPIKVVIEFLNTGNIKTVRLDKALSGMVMDKSLSFACGNIGNGGNCIFNGNKLIYGRWKSMMDRCYNPKVRSYESYGAIGVRVDERWHNFDNYVYDIQLLPGAVKAFNDISNYHLDKDFLQYNIPRENRIYSKDTCVWLSVIDNLSLKDKLLYIMASGSTVKILYNGNFSATLVNGNYIEYNVFNTFTDVYIRLMQIQYYNKELPPYLLQQPKSICNIIQPKIMCDTIKPNIEMCKIINK